MCTNTYILDYWWNFNMKTVETKKMSTLGGYEGRS
jgi:hypothetical protein